MINVITTLNGTRTEFVNHVINANVLELYINVDIPASVYNDKILRELDVNQLTTLWNQNLNNPPYPVFLDKNFRENTSGIDSVYVYVNTTGALTVLDYVFNADTNIRLDICFSFYLTVLTVVEALTRRLQFHLDTGEFRIYDQVVGEYVGVVKNSGIHDLITITDIADPLKKSVNLMQFTASLITAKRIFVLPYFCRFESISIQN